MSHDKIRLYLPHEVLIGLPYYRSRSMHLSNTNILRDMFKEVLGDFGFNVDKIYPELNRYLGVTKYDIDRLSNVCIYGSDIVFNALQEYRDSLNGEHIDVSIEVRADKNYHTVDNIIVIEKVGNES